MNGSAAAASDADILDSDGAFCGPVALPEFATRHTIDRAEIERAVDVRQRNGTAVAAPDVDVFEQLKVGG